MDVHAKGVVRYETQNALGSGGLYAIPVKGEGG